MTAGKPRARSKRRLGRAQTADRDTTAAVSRVDGVDDRTRETIFRYLREVRMLPNEAAKTHRFMALIAELFPGSTAVIEFAGGIEKLIRIETDRGQRHRRIDAYHGNAVIEFENSLRATEAEAKRQLREYTAGLWARTSGPARSLLCVASDGVVWKTFRPTLRTGVRGTLTERHIELESLRELTLTEQTIREFWIWITGFLFRPARLEPSPEHFSADFGATSPAFADAMAVLRAAWIEVGRNSEARLALQAWQKYLTFTYGNVGLSTALGRVDPEIETLFLKHTYLASIARFLVWAGLSRGRTGMALREVAGEILSGEYFIRENIENLVEDDFFQWARSKEAESILAPVWERILNHMLSYDLSRIRQDVLKGIYQELVDPKDRHDLGEYYTPEWLCERMVSEVLPAQGFVRVLDPACGSGSFLRAAIAHMLQANKGGSDPVRLSHILTSVMGIDIHPLAVTIARATYLLAVHHLIRTARRPIHIPVYLADSLFLPTEVTQLELGSIPTYEIRFGGDRRVKVPEAIVKTQGLFDPTITACAKIAVDQASTRGESEATLRAYLQRAVPGLAARADFTTISANLWTFASELADLIRRRRNSIWAFIIRNNYRPAMLREQFDVILGNPPWLSYRFIADPEYQDEIKKLAIIDYKIAPKGQKLFTQMELGAVFMAHSLNVFARSGGKLAFVMPRSILSADQHANLRRREYSAPVRIDRYWDLLNVTPLFNVPACVIFASRHYVNAARSYTLPMVEWSGSLGRENKDAPWAAVQDRLGTQNKSARLIYIGRRSALSTEEGRTSPTSSSAYASRFRQGATIVPRNFYFVRVHSMGDSIDPEAVYLAETDPEQAKLAKRPYQDVRLRGQVEGRFIYLTALSKNVLPFFMTDPVPVVLPLEEVQGKLEVKTAGQLDSAGFRHMAKWMRMAQEKWEEKRGEKADKQSCLEWLDYQGKLTRQDLTQRFLVVYNHSGKNLAAARIDRRELSTSFIVDVKLYWVACNSRAEAHYLTAVLNANEINEAIKPFQSMGLMGQRDIHKKVLDLPIPTYDPNKSGHRSLAELGARAESEVATLVTDVELPNPLGRQREFVRDSLRDTLQEIDAIVQRLI